MRAMRDAGRTTLTSIESQLLLRELYDKHFAIATHDNPSRPLSLVALHPKETVGPYSAMRRILKRYADLNIGNIFNISFKDFIDQPRELVEYMFEIAEDKTIQEGRKNDEAKKLLEASLGQGKP